MQWETIIQNQGYMMSAEYGPFTSEAIDWLTVGTRKSLVRQVLIDAIEAWLQPKGWDYYRETKAQYLLRTSHSPWAD